MQLPSLKYVSFTTSPIRPMRITLFKVPFIDKIYKYRVDNQNIFQKYNFFSTYQNLVMKFMGFRRGIIVCLMEVRYKKNKVNLLLVKQIDSFAVF